MRKSSVCFKFFRPLLQILLTAEVLSALDGSILPSQYAHRIWRTQDGLPSNGLYSVLPSPSAYLWAGTKEGLVRFDGHQFTTISPLTHPDMQGSYVGNVVEAKDSTVWFNTTKALHRLKDGKLTVFTEKDGLPSSLVARHALDHQDALWASTARGLVRIHQGKVTRFSRKDGLVADRTGAILVEPDGTVWIGAAGLTRYRQGRFQAFPATLNHPVVGALARDSQGTIWVGTYDGLYTFDGKDFHLDSRIPKGIINSIHIDRDGLLWVAVGNRGLLRIHGQEPAQLVQLPGLPTDEVTGIAEDRQGNLWLATGSGLAMLRRGPVVTFGKPEGLPSEAIMVLTQDRQQRIWLGSTEGLFILSGPSHRTVTEVQGLPRFSVSALHEDATGRMWVGLRGAIGWVEGNRFRALQDSSGPVQEQVLSLTTDPQGHLWTGTTRGLFRFAQGRRTTFGTTEGLMNNLAGTLQFDQHGHLWAGTNDGLFVWDGQRFSPRYLPSGSIRGVHLDPDGTVWIGTAGGGLYWHRQGQLHHANVRDGLVNDYVGALLLDRQGDFWITSPGSISRIARQDLLAFGEKKLARLHPIRLSASDGLREPGCNGGWQPDHLLARDGTLWFPSDSGALTIDPQRLRWTAPPPPRIEAIQLDGQSLDPLQPLRLAAGAGRLEIRFTSPDLLWAEQLRFRYQMVGVDKSWTLANSTRTASYNLLPPGEHRFLVEVMDRSGQWLPASTPFSLRQDPFFYRTWWFALLCLAAVALFGWLLYRMRIRQLQARHELVLSERTRIARELHDSLLQEVLGASLQLQGTAWLIPAQPDQAQQKVEQISEQLRLAFRETRDYIGHLRMCAEEQDLRESLRTLGMRMTAPQQLSWSWAQEGMIPALDSSLRFEILRMAREIIQNALKHAEASHLQGRLLCTGQSLVLEIQDNGKGFTPGVLPDDGRQHWGLVGLEERTKALRGSLEIQSNPGQGACVRCTIPLRQKSNRQFFRIGLSTSGIAGLARPAASTDSRLAHK